MVSSTKIRHPIKILCICSSFGKAAGVEGFPTADEFAENCADSSKGMTKEDPSVSPTVQP